LRPTLEQPALLESGLFEAKYAIIGRSPASKPGRWHWSIGRWAQSPAMTCRCTWSLM